jgi:hypothetical protein
MAVVRKMIDIIVEAITRFIQDDISPDIRALSHLKQWFERYKMDTKEKYREIRKLIKIRQIYLKGKVFVHNQTKGKKKGLRHKLTTEGYYKLLDEEERTKQLEFVKLHYSERTYYRHKKILRELNS